MPYKRKVRILFLAYGDAYRARLAATLALRLGASLLEARACMLAPARMRLSPQALDQASLAVQEVNSLDEALLQWADLVICLDRQSDAECPALPASVQKRCYPYAAPHDAASLAALKRALEQRIAGIIGGIKMLA